MKITFLLSSLFALFNVCRGANILIMLPTPTISHVHMFDALVKTLSEEHNVTFYSINKLSKNYTNVVYKQLMFNKSMEDATRRNQFYSTMYNLDAHKQLMLLYLATTWFHENLMTSEEMQKLLHNFHAQHYDLFITVNFMSEAFFKFAYLLNTPIIQVAPSIPLPWTLESVGNPTYLSHDFSFFLQDSSECLIGRLKRLLKNIYVRYYYESFFFPFEERLADRYFPKNTPPLKEIISKTDLLFVNTINEMGYSYTHNPNIVAVGCLHCQRASPLSKDLEEFINSSGEEGVIYFSLGSTVDDTAVPLHIKTLILNVFRILPQKILWKWAGDVKDLPSNVKVSQWYRQQDILGHNKTKLFITQAGMLSLQESVFHSVPVLMLPLIVDQFPNAQVAQKNGFGLSHNLLDLNQDLFYSMIQELLHNSKYREKTKRASESIRNPALKPSEKVKWWTNYIIKHKNVSFLRPPTDELSWVQVHEFDTYLFILAVTLFITFLSLRVIFLVLRMVLLYCKGNEYKKQKLL